MKKLLIIAALAVLVGCSAIMKTNQITINESDFDGSVNLHVSPGYVYTDNFRLGLSWDSKSPDGLIFLLEKGGVYLSIEGRGGLQFNIDGDIVKLNSIDQVTDFSHVYNETVGDIKKSSRRFIGSVELLDRMLSAKSVKVKVLYDKSYDEGDLLLDRMQAAIIGFRKFRVELKTITGN